MRKMHEYKIVKYFPNALSEEFVNIGVILDAAKPMERIITESEAKHLYCSALIGENKKFYGVIEHIHALVQNNTLHDPHHYFHNFTISDSKHLASDKSEDEILEGLFETYIGYKLHSEEKLDKRMKLIKDSFKIVKKEFKKHISIHHSKQFDFELENVKNKKIYHANVGSLGNKHDVFKMTMDTPLHKQLKHQYNFLDISTIIRENDSKERLALYQIDTHDYGNEEKIEAYMEQLIA
jgi:hypothetical protein